MNDESKRGFIYNGNFQLANSDSMGVASYDMSEFISQDGKHLISEISLMHIDSKSSDFNFKSESPMRFGLSNSEDFGSFSNGVSPINEVSDINTEYMQLRLAQFKNQPEEE